MAGFSNDLKELVTLYQEIQEKKNYLEGKTANVMTNSKYYESQRHAFSHLIVALDLEIKGSGEDQKRRSYREAIHHIENLDVNGYEYLAGVSLTELRERIEQSGFYTNIGSAETLRSDAVRHFNRGRDLRPINKQQAMEQFEKTIDLCTQGLQQITPVNKVDRRKVKLNTASLVIAIAAFSGFIIFNVIIPLFK